MPLIRNYIDKYYEDVKFNLQESGLFVPMWDTKNNLKTKISRDAGSIIVAIEENCAIGNAFIVKDGWCAFIYHLAVRESFRHRGIGKLLIGEVENRLRAKGDIAVSLFTEFPKWFAGCGYKNAGNFRCMYKEL